MFRCRLFQVDEYVAVRRANRRQTWTKVTYREKRRVETAKLTINNTWLTTQNGMFVFHNCELYVNRTGLFFQHHDKVMTQSHAENVRKIKFIYIVILKRVSIHSDTPLDPPRTPRHVHRYAPWNSEDEMWWNTPRFVESKCLLRNVVSTYFCQHEEWQLGRESR